MNIPSAIVSLLALILFLPPFSTAQRYTVSDLVQSDDSTGYALNKHAEVAGTLRIPGTDVYHAFCVNSKGLIQDLGTLGGTLSFGLGIANSGEIVGSSQLAGDSTSHAFRVKHGVMFDLGTLGGELSYANGISSSGEIAGTSTTADHFYRAFLFSRGNMMELGTLGGNESFGEAINRFGAVTGVSYLAGNSALHAFLYQDGVMTDLGSLLGGSALFDVSAGHAINDKGQVVGETVVSYDIGHHAFLFTGGKMIDLGTFGGSISIAHGINNDGFVVGEASLPNDQDRHAFLYIPDKGMTDLNSLIAAGSGWTLHVAQAINDKGEIVGFGLINGKSRAFLLKPVHRKGTQP